MLTRSHEMGPDHLLRVQCICNYMEEAASLHAQALGAGADDLAGHGLAWALAKIRLVLSRRPAAGEEVVMQTWPVAIERARFRRDFLLCGVSGDVLAAAVTQWVVMGLNSRRLERFPDFVAAMQPDNPPLALEDGEIRIPALSANAAPGPVFPVRLADIDQNRHVNNVRYVDFALEAAEISALPSASGGSPRLLDIVFRAEGRYGDVICSKTMPERDAPGACIHGLFRASDGQELARCRTVYS
ncbi:MAG: acyl-ACP thioesterase [Desulfovibrio sp.]|jgi:acyl-ACP thioesterase|nr:acyl-ACP thioesterase [Desulfovibrio sp.]